MTSWCFLCACRYLYIKRNIVSISCKKLIYDEELRQNMVDNAHKVVENNRGSVEKQYNYMKEYLN